jgi:hypothetical protein
VSGKSRPRSSRAFWRTVRKVGRERIKSARRAAEEQKPWTLPLKLRAPGDAPEWAHRSAIVVDSRPSGEIPVIRKDGAVGWRTNGRRGASRKRTDVELAALDFEKRVAVAPVSNPKARAGELSGHARRKHWPEIQSALEQEPKAARVAKRLGVSKDKVRRVRRKLGS